MTPQMQRKMRAELVKIVDSAATPTTERIAANRMIARIDGRLEEHDRLCAAMGLRTESPIVRTATSVSFHPMTAAQAQAHCKRRGL